ncbi:osmoprotectant ABC transporter substrate-binding protein [Staphylococcus sp. NRL 16/872]|uniref:osmoprotectant ABC transporter substrate-binding protein n=1 Tax=Staphylococcus sp. NRL 16/872 TaxID=2930131 RepID=UPI001FB26F2B|nr:MULTISPECIES: osmoprotectant ABC transporter substrate-binding protein [unclassified Staphylococcus]MCJ1655627.1 osmoprotectant ABC transporter substrate-binding protein [Staphylococcus sp. NRL 21/187]MCJ1661450.1 osmoprotectant ABC transporter substrate-binding protein [Staphylococcus sp. NRL 18/288]MCJ1667353.1 osmoprotectant ABC transporter substrate-binding protein [Staphylococcus sp. NRL 19/737]WEN69833.1 osmoprotectant ABC transporter substrate-binding protein [Staphylococcus sp. NRL 1
MKKFKITFILLALSLVVLSGCGLPGLGDGNAKDSVKITATETSETKIMANIEKLMIEHYTDGKIKPTIVGNLGSSIIQHNALQRGDVNMSAVRYTGTELTSVLDAPPTKDPKKAMAESQKLFKKKYDQKYYNSFGFANTYAFMVTKEVADKYHLEKVSDLKKYKDELRLGMDTQWMNRAGDGYPAFQKDYGFKFASARPMQIGLVYDALKNKKLDVAVGYSTDGRIAAYNLKVLKDDRKFFPPYDGSPLATEKLIKDNPEIDKALTKLENKISTKDMQKLNYEADGKGKEPAVIAEEYVKKHNYFEDDKKGGQK